MVLVDLPWTRDKDPRVPLGHASILAALRAAGIDARSVVAPVNAASTSLSVLVERVSAEAAGADRLLLAVGAYVWSEPLVQQLLPRLRAAWPTARIVLGGPQVTFAEDVDGLYPDADCAVRGAGEQVLVTLAGAEDRAAIPGVSWRESRAHGGQTRVDLARLPSPFLSGVVPVLRGGFLRWETKRGCRFACSFCQHRNPDAREFQRLPEGRVRDEIALFAQRGVADIAVLDPIFNDGHRSTAILEECKRTGLTARLSLQSRIEMADDAFLEAARGLDLRLEFGLQTIHKAEYLAVGRPNNLPVVERRLTRVLDEGHPVEISLIYGLPNQTLASFTESVRWCLEHGVPSIKAFPLMLLRGTKLSRERERWGLLESHDVIPQVVASDSFGPGEQRRMAAIASALRATEGAHPPLAQLLERADRLPEPAIARFTPGREVVR